MNHLLNLLNELAQYVPFDDALYAPILSVVLLLVKKIGSIKNGAVMAWLTITGAGLAGAGAYVFTHYGENPQVAAVSAALIGLVSQPFYKLVLKPLVSAIGKKWASEVAKAAQLNREKMSATVPATGLPVATIADFDK